MILTRLTHLTSLKHNPPYEGSRDAPPRGGLPFRYVRHVRHVKDGLQAAYLHVVRLDSNQWLPKEVK